MYVDGLTLMGDSDIKREQTNDDRGAEFPANPVDGQEFELVSGETSVLHIYSGDAEQWLELTNLANSPYDIGLTIFDRPRSNDVVCKHRTIRNFKLYPNFAMSEAVANVLATEDYTLDIFRIATDLQTEEKIGELTFAAGQTEGTFTAVKPDLNIIFVSGQTLMIRSPEVRDSTLKSVDVTIAGELLVQGAH